MEEPPLLAVLTDSRPKAGEEDGVQVSLHGGRRVRRSPRLLPRAGGPRSARAGWGKSGVRVQPDEQPGGRDTQDLGEMEQRQDRNIALPQFDIADNQWC